MVTLFALLSGVFLLAGGLLLLRYGLNRLLWYRLQRMLLLATVSPWRGLVTGTIAAALFQSSTAVCLLTIGLVTAEYLTFRQALGVILGANIGTCSTVGLVGLFNTEKLLPLLLITAVCALPLRRTRNIGLALAGLAGMFGGLYLLGYGMTALQTLEPVHRLLRLADLSAWHAILAGVLITFMFQSSSAATIMLMTLTENGVFSLTTAACIVYGSNLGSCLSSVLVSSVAPLAAKRVAAAHVLVNILGILLFLPVTEQLVRITGRFAADPALHIAAIHTVFNIVSSLAILPAAGYFARFIEIILPKNKAIWR